MLDREKLDDENYWMITAMENYGGSFVRSLAAALRVADYSNQRKLKNAFPEIVEHYKRMGRILAEKNKKK